MIMKTLFEKYRLWLNCLIYVFCFLIIYLRFSGHYFIIRDDVLFTRMAHSQSLYDFLLSRYNGWSSRLFIEVFIYVFCLLPHIVWKIFMPLCFLGCGIGFCYLLNVKNLWYKTVVLFAVTTLPNVYLNNSGWIATTSSYLVPLFFGIWSLCSISDVCYHRKISFMKAFGYVLATLIATNMEQYCFFIGGLLAITFLWCLYKQKKIRLILGLQLTVVLFNVLMFLAAPGNQVRYVSEVQKSPSEYATWSIGQKMLKGVEHLEDDFFFDNYVLSLIFIAISLACSLLYRENKQRFHIAIWFGSLVCSLVIYIRHYYQPVYPVGDNLLGFFYIFPLLLMCGLLLELFLFGKLYKSGYVLFGIFVFGIVSSLLMAFSPTIYASNVRVFIILLYALLFIVLYLYVQYGDKICFAHLCMILFVVFWISYNEIVNYLL